MLQSNTQEGLFMLNPVLPAPRTRRIQTARNAVDVILNARSAADLRLYEWEDRGKAPSGKTKWYDTETKKTRYQISKPGTGRGKKAQGDATAAPAEGEQPQAKQPAQKKPAAPRKPKVDHNEVGDRIEKMLGTDFADQDVGALREELLSLTGAQLDELKKRFTVKGGRTKADVAGRIAGHAGSSRKSKSAAELQQERDRQAAMPIKSNASVSMNAVEINKDNLKSALASVTKQFEESDRKLSPNRAKELAAAKLSDIIQKKVADIDDRVRSGNITPEEESWYDSIHVDGWSPTRELEMMSGSRTIGADRDMMRGQPVEKPSPAQPAPEAAPVPGSPVHEPPRLPEPPAPAPKKPRTSSVLPPGKPATKKDDASNDPRGQRGREGLGRASIGTTSRLHASMHAAGIRSSAVKRQAIADLESLASGAMTQKQFEVERSRMKTLARTAPTPEDRESAKEHLFAMDWVEFEALPPKGKSKQNDAARQEIVNEIKGMREANSANARKRLGGEQAGLFDSPPATQSPTVQPPVTQPATSHAPVPADVRSAAERKRAARESHARRLRSQGVGVPAK